MPSIYDAISYPSLKSYNDISVAGQINFNAHHDYQLCKYFKEIERPPDGVHASQDKVHALVHIDHGHYECDLQELVVADDEQREPVGV